MYVCNVSNLQLACWTCCSDLPIHHSPQAIQCAYTSGSARFPAFLNAVVNKYKPD